MCLLLVSWFRFVRVCVCALLFCCVLCVLHVLRVCVVVLWCVLCLGVVGLACLYVC